MLKEKHKPFLCNNVADIVPVLSSYLTNCCPKTGKYLTNGIVKLFFGNKLFLRISYKRQNKTIRQHRSSGPILIIADLNIGDAINIQVACQTLKQLFPEKEIHYILNKKAYPLIEANPFIDRSFPVFSGGELPTASDVKQLKKVMNKTDYSLLFNFCPFFEAATFNGRKKQVLNHYPLSIGIAYDELKTQNVNHLRKKIFTYLTRLFPEEACKNQVQLKDVSLFIDKASQNDAQNFLEENGFYGKKGLVLFNPDATSPYTKFPLNKQVEMVQALLDNGVKYLLISTGFVFREVEKDILERINISKDTKCIIVPHRFSLSTYAALVDQCNVYITNDTGPMHLAASRKKDKQGNLLRNKTAIFAIFGATPARIYAYDSENSFYFPAAQDAPSHVFVSQSNCRNVTCINKLSKRCSKVQCFDGLNPQKMAEKIIRYLKEFVWN